MLPGQGDNFILDEIKKNIEFNKNKKN